MSDIPLRAVADIRADLEAFDWWNGRYEEYPRVIARRLIADVPGLLAAVESVEQRAFDVCAKQLASQALAYERQLKQMQQRAQQAVRQLDLIRDKVTSRSGARSSDLILLEIQSVLASGIRACRQRSCPWIAAAVAASWRR